MSLDADRLRRYYNKMDRWLDRSSLREEVQQERALKGASQPVTAQKALEEVWPLVRAMDRSAILKQVTGTDDLTATGTASRWEFFFDLPKRRAKAAAAWFLPLDEDAEFGPPRLNAVFRPFPVPRSMLYQMIDEGRLLYRQLNGHWREEMKRTPVLPHDFKDSDVAVRECIAQGLDVSQYETTLVAKGVSTSELVWMAETRHDTYRTKLK